MGSRARALREIHPPQPSARFDQVRIPGMGLAVHRLAGADFTPDTGRTYRTVCGRVLTKAEGAVLTSRDVSCSVCQDPNRWRRAVTALLEA